MHFACLLGFLFLAEAHPDPARKSSNEDIIHRPRLAVRCSSYVTKLNEKRWKRSLSSNISRDSSIDVPVKASHYKLIQNDTCVLSPAVTPGPYYWPRSQLLRQDVTGSQHGVPLWLEIGVMDMATCAPLAGAMVDIWSCNATGSYSSFTKLSPNRRMADNIAEKGFDPTKFEIGKADVHTDAETWLRGMWPTDEHGIVQMKTIFPGFYAQRAIHIHVQVHLDWTLHENGTLATHKTVHTGQFFFAEELEQKVMALEPYASHTQIQRVQNTDDPDLSSASENGYSPFVSVVPLDEDDLARKGLVGYITVGVDTSVVEPSVYEFNLTDMSA